MNITIIGTGNMGKGIGYRLLEGNHRINLINLNQNSANALADDLRALSSKVDNITVSSYQEGIQDDIVVLAVWYPINLKIVEQFKDQLTGKIIIDIANPLNESFDGLATQAGISSAEEVARALPQSRVVKAFNTTFAGTLVQGNVAGQPLDVFIAGDDEDAKATVAELARAGQLNPIDVGSLSRAQQLEGLGFLGISLQQPHELGFMSGWKLVS